MVERRAARPARRETLLFAVATAVVLAHVVADSFVAKTLWYVPEAGHTGALEARPRQYEERVVGFFDQALLGR